MDSKGFVAVFTEPIRDEQVQEIVQTWLDHFPRVEQVCPGDLAGTVTLTLENTDTLITEKNMQFRVMSGEDFSWIYFTIGERVMETSGLPYETNTLPLDVLVDLEGIEEVVDQVNERRLEELEKAGVLK